MSSQSSESDNRKKKRSKNKSTTSSDEPKIDPIGDLKRQIEEAKANKDFKQAQKLREQLWTLQDTALGYAASPTKTLSEILPSPTPPPPPPSSSEEPEMSENPNVKTLRKLEKKLKAIEDLKVKRDKGIKLEKTQLAKITTENELLEEIKTIKEIMETMS